MKTKEILYTSTKKVQYILTRDGKMAKVDVKILGERNSLMTYYFNNVPLYHHQYLSWKNLNCCGGFPCDESYLNTAVQEHKKLVSNICQISEEIMTKEMWMDNFQFNKEEIDFVSYIKPWYKEKKQYELTMARKGCLADYYNLDEIIEIYGKHDIDLNYHKTIDRIKVLWTIPLIELYRDEAIRNYNFDFANSYSVSDLVINGLALGYPIESTVGIL